MESSLGELGLSNQEERTLLLSISGYLDKEIALQLGVSVFTVRTYWRRIRQKLGGGTRQEVMTRVSVMDLESELQSKVGENQRLRVEIERRRAAELAVERERMLLQSILEQMPSAVRIVDAKTGELLITNEHASRTYGNDIPVPAKADQNAWTWYDAEGNVLDWRCLPLTRTFESGVGVPAQEMRLETTDGRVTWLSESAAPVRNREGEIVANVAVSLDVTRQKAVEETLQTYRDVFQSAQAGLGVDDGVLLTHVNEAFAAMHGYTPDELIGRPLDSLFTREEKSQSDKLAKAIALRGDATLEERHVRKDGSTFSVIKHISVIPASGSTPLYRVITILDLSVAVPWQELVSDPLPG